MDLLMPCLYAFLGGLAFCVIFEMHTGWFLLSASLNSAAGWLVYLLLNGYSSVFRYMVATIVVATLAEVFARIFKAPATIFLIIGILPLVPGGGMYYTMKALIDEDMQTFVSSGMETAIAAVSIAIGCSLVSSMARILTLKRRHYQEAHRRKKALLAAQKREETKS